MTELIKVKAEGAIVRLTLNNPEQRNPMSNDMIEAFIHCFQSPAVQDAGVVIIAAEGKDYCAGGNINDFRDIIDASAAEQWEACERFRYMFELMHQLKPVTVAAVQGRALGGGCGLVAGCDFAIATENAQFGTPEIKLGAFPMVIVPPLIQAMGERRTMYMATTGAPISAQTALEYGLVQKVVADDVLEVEVNAFCEMVGNFSPTGFRVGKSTVRACAEASYSSGLEIGMGMRSIVFSSEAFKSGIRKFLDK
ncbi:MAG: enoyl-CoA hydratase/isomerase family protein [Porticoccaceae bacterium]|nr:enoyl-CoA hydratase/isomerase family protein [Pseudomonadales bacterium]MCP5172165.1 enoyl-CoA hydratase/isomerase family protein [Pseudomonadales bacterium]